LAGPARELPARRWRLLLSAELGQPRVDQAASDADARREERQRVGREERRLRDLDAVDPDLAARVLGGEADHERVREGPGLAAEVAHVRDLDADLFADLARDGLFERLAGLHEARQRAEEGPREVAGPREQRAL